MQLFTAHGMELQNILPAVFRGQTQKWEAESAKMKTENCKYRYCLKAGYEMAHNFTFPEDTKPGAISSSSYGYTASLFSCWADLPSWPKPMETGLRPYLLSQTFYHQSRSWEDWLCLPCSLIHWVLLESGDTVQASVCVIYAPLCPCRLTEGAVMI